MIYNQDMWPKDKPSEHIKKVNATRGPNGRPASNALIELAGVERGTPEKPVKIVAIENNVSKFKDAMDARVFSELAVIKSTDAIETGYNSADERTRVGTGMKVLELQAKRYEKVSEKMPNTIANKLTPEQLLEHASNPVKWMEFMWNLDRPPNDKQLEIASYNGNELIMMPRQILGKTTAVAMSKAAHPIIFQPGIPILVATNVEDSAKKLMEIVAENVKKYADLCGFLQVTKDNEKEFELSNGSKVKALSSGSSAPRGFTAKILILDEAAYISDDRFYKELLPTTASIDNPVIIASTTPNGKQGWFYKYWTEMNWKHITATRSDCHWKSDEWFENKRREMTESAYRQEFECEFLDVQNAVFTAEQIDSAMEDFPTWDLKR